MSVDLDANLMSELPSLIAKAAHLPYDDFESTVLAAILAARSGNGKGEGGVPKPECLRFMKWMRNQHLSLMILDFLLKGFVKLYLDKHSELSIELTEKGRTECPKLYGIIK